MTEQSDFILDLEGNAKDSLIHGIEHFSNVESRTFLKYTILHLFHATELYLKARLAKAHMSLIYQRPEELTRNGKTVDFDTLLDRLRAVGVSFSEQDARDINYLRKLRNSIEHSRIEFSTSEIESYIGRVVRFLENFLKTELQIDLQSVIGGEKSKTLTESLFSYEERLDRAIKKMELVVPDNEVEFAVDYCPKCNEETVPLLDHLTDYARCYFCNLDLYLRRCDNCSIPVIFEKSFGDRNEFLCEVCSNPELLEQLQRLNAQR